MSFSVFDRGKTGEMGLPLYYSGGRSFIETTVSCALANKLPKVLYLEGLIDYSTVRSVADKHHLSKNPFTCSAWAVV
jgi:hypothetical protein